MNTKNPELIIRKNLLIAIGSKILKMSDEELAKAFKMSRMGIFKILKNGNLNGVKTEDIFKS